MYKKIINANIMIEIKKDLFSIHKYYFHKWIICLEVLANDVNFKFIKFFLNLNDDILLSLPENRCFTNKILKMIFTTKNIIEKLYV
jgi:hypothetical protein